MRHSAKQWLYATNPWALPASAMPALVALSFVFYCRSMSQAGNPVPGVGEVASVNWLFAVISLVGAVVAQMSGNLFNDYFDYTSGVDVPDSYGVNRSLIDKQFEPRESLAFGLCLSGVTAAAGLGMAFSMPFPKMLILIGIGLAGLLLAFFYTFLKYMTLGDLVIFTVYGLLIALGLFFASTGILTATVLLVSAPSGFWVVNILNSNNVRDRFTDCRNNSKVRTAPIAFGPKACIAGYIVLGVASYLLLALDAALGIVKWTVPVLSLISLPSAVKLCKKMRLGEDPAAIPMIDADTARFVAFFSILVAAGNFLGVLL